VGMPVFGLVITISDVELSAEQSVRVVPALDRVFGSDAMTEVSTSGPYHLWRLTTRFKPQRCSRRRRP
jgi:hypothetical protein